MSFEPIEIDVDTANEIERMQQHYSQLRSYEQRMTGPGFRRMVEQRDAALLHLLRSRYAASLAATRILDVGCGSGRVMNWLVDHGANPASVIGIDLQPDRIATAKAAYPHLTFIEGSGEILPFTDTRFDIVIAFTLFSSIIDPHIARQVAAQIRSVLQPNGIVIWYDIRYPNPANSNLRAMTRTRIRRLFPDFKLQLQSITLLPPLAERLPVGLYPILSSIPVLNSHYFGMLHRCPPSTLPI